MKNPITKQIMDHLDFLGYKAEDVSGENEIDIINAVSEIKSNLTLRVFNNNAMLIAALFSIADSNAIVTQQFLDAINSANAKSAFSKAYYRVEEDKKVALVIETFAIEYGKQAFVILLDVLEREIGMYLKDLLEYYSVK